MNYLGHLLVLPDSGLISLGNLLGDFVKGRLDSIADPQLRLGVALHRELDRYTDQHPLVRAAIARISSPRRRVAGVLIDVFFDHFYAQSIDIDALRPPLLPHLADLPAPLQSLPERMITSHWFGAYATPSGIGAVLHRMEQRRGRPLGLSGAEQELSSHYQHFEDAALAFLPDAIAFTRETLLRLQSASLAGPPPAAAAVSSADPPQTS
ncbi:MAG: ACP phosphodiesterase [Acidobacteriota bacterium]